MLSGLQQLLNERESFLFDLDGTLVDSNTCHEQAYLKALRPRVPEVAAAFRYEPCKGKRTKDALRDLGITDESLIEEINAAKQQAYRDLAEAGKVQLIDGAREVLTTLRSRSARLFVVTGGSRRSSDSALRRLGIFDWFEGIVTADDVVNGKPDPECWLYCVNAAALDPQRALIIEDAWNGILAARAAGIASVAVNNVELADLPEYVGSMKDIARVLNSGVERCLH